MSIVTAFKEFIGTGRMPAEQPKTHEVYDFNPAGKLTVWVSPAKMRRANEMMKEAEIARDAIIDTAEQTLTNVKATAKKVYDETLANAQPLRDKAIADATAAFEARRQEIGRWSVTPAAPEEVASFIASATPAGHPIDLRNVAPTITADPVGVAS